MTPLPYVVFAVYSLPKSGKYQKIRNLAKSKRRIRGETTPGAKRIGCVRNAGSQSPERAVSLMIVVRIYHNRSKSD